MAVDCRAAALRGIEKGMDMTVNASVLLDFIARYESRGDYNAVWGGIRAADRPNVPLSEMTVGEVLAWQDRIDPRYMSEAAGRYQILEDTLRGLYRQAGVPLSALYDKRTQDKLAMALLRRRGLDDYLAGAMSPEAFALSLAKEWASLPIPFDIERGGRTIRAGQSYYAGDGLNEAHADLEEFMSAVIALRGKPEPMPRSNPAKSTTLQAAFVAAMATVGQALDAAKGAVAQVSEALGVSPETALAVVAAGALLWITRERWRRWLDGVR